MGRKSRSADTHPIWPPTKRRSQPCGMASATSRSKKRAPNQKCARPWPRFTSKKNPPNPLSRDLGLTELEVAGFARTTVQAQLGAQFKFDRFAQFRPLDQSLASVISSLPDAFALEAVPGSALLHNRVQCAKIEQVAF